MKNNNTGKIKFAKLENSPRLQSVLRRLLDGDKHSTLDLIINTKAKAISAAISELRCNGISVECKHRPGTMSIYDYWLPCQN